MKQYTDINDDELTVFVEEAEEHIGHLNRNIIKLEGNGKNPDIIQEIFRSAHTLKGSSAILGHTRMIQVTHAMESLLDKLRDQKFKINQEIISALLQAVSSLSILKDEVLYDSKEYFDIKPVIKLLKAAEETSPPQEANSIANDPRDTHITHEHNKTCFNACHEDQLKIADNRKKGMKIYLIQLSLNKSTADMPNCQEDIANKLSQLGEIVKLYCTDNQTGRDQHKHLDSEFQLVLCSNKNVDMLQAHIECMDEIDDILIAPYKYDDNIVNSTAVNFNEPITDEKLLKLSPSLKTIISAGNNGGIQSVRLDTRTLDKITGITGNLIIDCLQINKISKMLETKYVEDKRTRNLELISKQVMNSVNDIHQDIIELRMLPIDILFHIFPRMIEDLSHTQGKEIDFSIEGEDVELDRTILGQIRDPLIHLLRNAVDHGIELPEHRIKINKSSTGKLLLSARQEKDSIIITLEDDGQGISPQEVREAAINKGCISSKLANELTTTELIDLIFLPGMSTTNQATEVSGRGIGLDIVRSNIEQLNGTVSINTRVNQGTIFTIQLPRTIASLHGFMVSSNGSIYVIPKLPVIETVKMRTKDIKSIQGQDFIKINQQIIPVFNINRINRQSKAGRKVQKEQVHIIMVRVGANVAGITIDELMTERVFIVNTECNQPDDMIGVAGTTTLEDGRNALIVNIPSFIRASLLKRWKAGKLHTYVKN